MKLYVKRLKRGEDLLIGIDRLCREKDITAGVIVSGVGCVSRAKIRDASGVTVREINEDMEIVSLNGTVSKERIHAHVAFSKENLSTIGGHLTIGCIVNTTCELAILSDDGVAFSEKFDDQTGYGELVVSQK